MANATARYRVLEASYIDGRIVEVGEEVEYTGLAGPNLRAVDDALQAEAAALAALFDEARSYGLEVNKSMPVARMLQLIAEFKQRRSD